LKLRVEKEHNGVRDPAQISHSRLSWRNVFSARLFLTAARTERPMREVLFR
jgi:hypothetical protein